MDDTRISKVYAQLDPPLWLVTAAAGGQRGGLIATTVTQASIVAEFPRQLITIAQMARQEVGDRAAASNLIDPRGGRISRWVVISGLGIRHGRD
jgi:hypothetical protein